VIVGPFLPALFSTFNGRTVKRMMDTNYRGYINDWYS
jgi:hypothetical protein